MIYKVDMICGRGSALAVADLVELGYTNVYDFGGIIDWEYDVVTE